MNKHVMAIAVCLALQPVVSLGAETMIQPGVKDRDSKQSFEIQRSQEPARKPDRATSRNSSVPGANDPRNGVEPEDRHAHRSVARHDGAQYGVAPEDKPAKIIQPEDKPKASSQYVTQHSGQGTSGRKQAGVAKSCIPMRSGNPNGVASQEPNRPGSVRNDCDPMTQPRAMPDGSHLVRTFPDGARLYATTHNGDVQKLSAIDQRGRALKVEIVQNPPKDLLIGPNDAIERGNKQRAAEGGERRQATLSDVDNPTLVKKCIVKILAPSSLLGPNDKLLGPNNLIGPNNSLYWDMAASGMGCPKG